MTNFLRVFLAIRPEYVKIAQDKMASAQKFLISFASIKQHKVNSSKWYILISEVKLQPNMLPLATISIYIHNETIPIQFNALNMKMDGIW